MEVGRRCFVFDDANLTTLLPTLPTQRATAPPTLPDFDPEELTAHKREWAQRQRASGGGGGEGNGDGGDRLFDHFLIVVSVWRCMESEAETECVCERGRESTPAGRTVIVHTHITTPPSLPLRAWTPPPPPPRKPCWAVVATRPTSPPPRLLPRAPPPPAARVPALCPTAARRGAAGRRRPRPCPPACCTGMRRARRREVEMHLLHHQRPQTFVSRWACASPRCRARRPGGPRWGERWRRMTVTMTTTRRPCF